MAPARRVSPARAGHLQPASATGAAGREGRGVGALVDSPREPADDADAPFRVSQHRRLVGRFAGRCQGLAHGFASGDEQEAVPEIARHGQLDGPGT